jgi:hypothetical protein
MFQATRVGRGGRGEEAEVLGQGCQAYQQHHRLEPCDYGIAALDLAAEGDGLAVCQEVSVEEPALGFLREFHLEVEVGGHVGGAVGVAPGGDVLATTRKEGTQAE